MGIYRNILFLYKGLCLYLLRIPLTKLNIILFCPILTLNTLFFGDLELIYVNNYFDHLIKYLSITLFIMFTMIESLRLYLGQNGNLSYRVPELASFLMLSVFMQLPLITYFLFNPYLMNTPLELTLHAVLWVMIIFEIFLSFIALKEASSMAKGIYLSSSKMKLI